jgi:tRNA modification GTPase
LLDAAARLEAHLDFADEDDIPQSIDSSGFDEIAAVRAEVEAALGGAHRGERLREGFTVVIAGRPNAGKSTLLNALAQRDVAIVSPHAGTTRDAIEVRCDLAGLPVLFVDTAGWRATDDPVEQAGIERARQRTASADLVLWLDAGDSLEPRHSSGDAPHLHVRTKADLMAGAGSGHDIEVSAKTGAGMDALIRLVQERAQAGLGAGDAVVTRERQRAALGAVVECLARAELAYGGGRVELAAEDLRLALRALGRISGQVDVDEVLDRIFSRFCIGK